MSSATDDVTSGGSAAWYGMKRQAGDNGPPGRRGKPNRPGTAASAMPGPDPGPRLTARTALFIAGGGNEVEASSYTG